VTIDPQAAAVLSTTPLAGAAGDRTALERMKTVELAHEFEASMLLQMLRQMRQATLEEPDEEKEAGLSADTMLDTVDSELARQLSRNGGFGLADVMAKAISRQMAEAAGTTEDSTATADRSAGGSGWTADPLSGGMRFAGSGALGLAYGHTVQGTGGSLNESGLGALKLTDRDADSPIGRRVPTLDQ
jgi:hypothetical protein